MNTQEFLESIKEGKWFLVKGKYDEHFIVKMKPVTLEDIDTFVESLWLSNDDWETMCFSEYDSSSWEMVNGQFVHNAAFNYHFGSTEGPLEDSIYDEGGRLNVSKMKDKIMGYAKKDFITESELNKIWEKIVAKDFSEFETLSYQ